MEQTYPPFLVETAFVEGTSWSSVAIFGTLEEAEDEMHFSAKDYKKQLVGNYRFRTTDARGQVVKTFG